MTELEFEPWEVFVEGRKEGKGEGWGLGAVVLKRRIREQGPPYSPGVLQVGSGDQGLGGWGLLLTTHLKHWTALKLNLKST